MKAQIAKTFEWALVALGFSMFLYHMVSTQYILVGTYAHLTIHLAFVLIVVFVSTGAESRRGLVWAGQGCLILVTLAVTGYILANIDHLSANIGFPPPRDVAIGLILIALVIEAVRQAWGLTLPLIGAAFLLYFAYGHMLPQPLYHRDFPLDYIVSYLSIGFSGIYNLLSISANQVFLFVLFGALLSALKLDDMFFELGKAVGRVVRGGAGHTAVVASSCIGMISGTAIGNVATTGTVTIPFMIRAGYRPEVAGGIEATASTGGQITPPIMGAAAFLMAFFIGVPYTDIMIASVIPAAMFYFSLVVAVRAIAVTNNIIGSPEPTDTVLIRRRLPVFLIPLGVLVGLLIARYSPTFAAFWAIIAALAVGYAIPDTREKPLVLLKKIARGAVMGAKIGSTIALVGLIAQTMITTGLGSKFTNVVLILGGESIGLILLLTMVAAIILGTGIPTVAAYSLIALTVVPVLTRLGVDAVAANFFGFYFAIISAVTPPVALAALAGASIANASYFRTSIQAFKLALPGFVIPFLIVFNPILVFSQESSIWDAWFIVIGFLALLMLASAVFNCGIVPFTPLERVVSLAIFCLLVAPSFIRGTALGSLELPMMLAGGVLLVGLAIRQVSRAATARPTLAINP